ncbi:FRG domain-containing protein [Terrimesophilobacter mesophilus]|nr:FRG domain-containing protein [Terrimesophilobacter mesophilus]
MAVIGSIGVYNQASRFAWRGMSSSDHNLNSSLQRLVAVEPTEEVVRRLEVSILQEARNWGLGYGDTDYRDDLQLLADLQHFSVPTRMIDFTSNPMTALWFACQRSKEDKKAKGGVVLALNVTGWKNYQSVGASLPGVDEEKGKPAPRESQTLLAGLVSGQAFLVEASHPNARLRAQEGFFAASAVPPSSAFLKSESTAFFGLNVADATSTRPEVVEQLLLGGRKPGGPANIPYVAIIIKSSNKKKLLAYLGSTYNRSARVLFPDFEGFSSRGKFRASMFPRD